MKNYKYSTSNFIEKAHKIHNNKYEYLKTQYIKWGEKVVITCPSHGDFEQTPRDHLSNRGCPKCARELTADRHRHNLNDFTEKANKKYNNKFDYSKVVYKNAKTKVKIICPIHGDFEQMPDTHLNSKYGCIKCSNIAVGKSNRNSNKIFIDKAKKLYKDLFDYSKVKYITAIKNITVICNTCNKEFLVTPNHHLNSGSCPYCTTGGGFDKTKPGILYYLSINNGEAYKIGITNNSVEKRFSKAELAKIKIIKIWEFAIGFDAFKAEQYYLKEYKYAKYTGDPLLVSGNTELFNQDVLLLDDSVT